MLAVTREGYLVSAGDETFIRIWNTQTGEKLREMSGHTAAIFSLAIMQNGDIVSGSADATIKVWDGVDGREKQTLKAHLQTVFALASFSHDGSLLASASGDKKVYLWNMQTYKPAKILTGHTSQLYALAVLNNGNLASGSWDKTIRIWRTAA